MLRIIISMLIMSLGLAVTHANAKQKQQVKDWNFLVFINGVNNLDPFGTSNINQMEEVGSTDHMNIIVQWGSEASQSVKRLLVQKDDQPYKVTSPVVKDLGQVDMGDYKQLVDFVDWANTTYPAQHTFVVVWNHGSGWHRINSFMPTDISYDDRTGNSITTEQLGEAMKEIAEKIGKKVDIYGSDACLMGMVEVADQMSDSVNYFVGSQDLEPGDGWPYSPFLQKWAAHPEMSAKEVSQLISREFVEAYSGGVYGNMDVTMSAYDLTKIEPLRKAIANLSEELMSKSAAEIKTMKDASYNTKYFSNMDYLDLYDFLAQIENQKITGNTLQAVRDAHKEFVIANDQNMSSNVYGLSIWLPSSGWTFDNYWDRYQNLNFNKNTGWGNFLKKLAAE